VNGYSGARGATLACAPDFYFDAEAVRDATGVAAP
jgi:hypothetical protein